MTSSHRPDLAEVLKALYGTLLLMRGDRRGAALFSATAAGAVRSFWAYLLILPVWLWRAQSEEVLSRLAAMRITPLQFNLLFACQMMIAVFFVFLVLERLTRRIHVRHRFPLFVSVQNWAGAYVLLLLALLHLVISGPWPVLLTRLLETALVLFSWFLTRATLGTGPLLSAGITVLVLLGQQIVALISTALFAFLLALSRVGGS